MRKRTVVDMRVTIFTTICRERGVDPFVMINIIRDVRALGREERERAKRLREWADALCKDEEWAKEKCAACLQRTA